MARTSNDVSRIVCANTIQENEKRLLEARIKNQGKGRARQDLNKLLSKLNQAVEGSSMKTSGKLSLSCYNRSVTSCWYGPVLGFPPGSWWGIRMDCSRDCMHEPFDADIHEGPFGVISVCTSHTTVNEDLDFGDFLTLTGQVYREEQPNADPFIRNYKNQIPLRLIRSYNLQDDIAPNTGYRYDGLYTVIGCWIGAALDGTKYNKFALMRLADQESSSLSGKSSEDLSSARRCIPLTRSSCPNAYDLRRCSHNTGSSCGKRKLSNRDNWEDQSALKTIDISKKCVPESSIVTRHVFKKLPSNAENTTTSVPDQKTLMCLGVSTTKTHSTNISIRMGLYESSHNAQDAKKSISTMLKKPSKPIDVTIHTMLDIESVRLTPKEDNKLVERIDADKTRANPRPSENVYCNGQVAANNANDVACPLNKRRRNMSSEIVHSSEQTNFVSPLLNSLDNTNIIECKEQLENAKRYLDAQNLNTNDVPVQKLNPSDESQPKNSITIHGRTPKHLDITETPSESFCEQGIKSLDSLTPDKILNLINKEKHHPLSKLLIENVIGLTTEKYTTLNASEEKTTDSKSKTHISQRINLKKRRKGGDNIKENVACLDNRRYCKYSKSKRLSWKVTKQSDVEKFDKMVPNVDRQSCNDVDQKDNGNAKKSDRSGIPKKNNNEYLSPFHVQTSLQTIAQHTRSSYDIKTRLRTDKNAVLSKQKFSNSSIKKNKYKKRDREIANLSIDANFGPVTRGPRNRRLRCKSNTYTNKKCYSTFNTVIYPPSKRYKSNFKRKSKPTKVSRQRTADRQTKDRYSVATTLRANSKDINNSIEKQKNFKDTSNKSENRNSSNNASDRKKNGTIMAEVDCNISKTILDRSLRKKLTRTIPLSHRAAQTSRLHYFHKKQVEKPNTMDATTQCRLISENSEVYVIEQLNDQRAILKMEWDKLERLKLESLRDDRESQIHRNSSRLCAVSAFTEDNASRKNDEECADALQDRASAFVPVNAFDSDLRIARLRSIGFKPIIKPRSPLVVHDSGIIQNVITSKVMKRDVAEEYDKYANNEDNNVVVYMDDELQYQDIEEEDDGGALARNASKRLTLKGTHSKNSNVSPETLPSRENSKSPWHGWKKIVTNNRSYWIGW